MARRRYRPRRPRRRRSVLGEVFLAVMAFALLLNAPAWLHLISH